MTDFTQGNGSDGSTAAQKLRSAIEQHEPGTYWGPDGAQMSRDELLALLDVEEAARPDPETGRIPSLLALNRALRLLDVTRGC